MVAAEGISTEDLNTIIDNIVKICNEVGTNNPSMMATTIELLKKWDFEFKPLLNGTEHFRNGFVNFLMQEPNVKLQDSEVDAAIDYIKKHIQSEIGTWREDEVINALKNWRLSTMPKPVTPQTVSPETPHVTPQNPPQQTFYQHKIEQAKSRVSMMTEEEMRRVLNKVINLGYDNVLDILLEP